MGLQHYTQDMSKLPLKTNINVLFKRKYTHPTLICRGTDGRTDGRTDARTDGRTHARTDGRTHGRTDARTDGRTENIYSIFRDKLLLLGEHGFRHRIFTNSRLSLKNDAPLLVRAIGWCLLTPLNLLQSSYNLTNCDISFVFSLF